MADRNAKRRRRRRGRPWTGYLGVGFALLGIFTAGVVFVPLALLCSLLALSGGRFVWGTMGLLLSVLGLLTSPVLLASLGLGALAISIDLPFP